MYIHPRRLESSPRQLKNLLDVLLGSSFTAPTFTFVQHVEPIWSRHHAPNMRGVAGVRGRKRDRQRQTIKEREREPEAPTPNSSYVIKSQLRRSLSLGKAVATKFEHFFPVRSMFKKKKEGNTNILLETQGTVKNTLIESLKLWNNIACGLFVKSKNT